MHPGEAWRKTAQQTLVVRVDRERKRGPFSFRGGWVHRIETDPCFGDWTLVWKKGDGTVQVVGRSEGGVMDLRQDHNSAAPPSMYSEALWGNVPGYGLFEGLPLMRMCDLEVHWDKEMHGIGETLMVVRTKNILVASKENTGYYIWVFAY